MNRKSGIEAGEDDLVLDSNLNTVVKAYQFQSINMDGLWETKTNCQNSPENAESIYALPEIDLNTHISDMPYTPSTMRLNILILIKYSLADAAARHLIHRFDLILVCRGSTFRCYFLLLLLVLL